MKVALVHDYLREYGGAERVVEVLHEMYPQAPLYTAFVDWQALGSWASRFKDWHIRTTWAQNCFLMRQYHSPLRFLTPWVWNSLDLSEFDVIISSSGWFICRGVKTSPSQLHISYIHHPPRNLYGFPTGTKASPLIRAYAAVINPFLRKYDYATAQKVDYLIANSKTTAERIKKFYKRDAEVIYPPVDVSSIKYQVSSNKINVTRDTLTHDTYYLSVGRLNYAKRVDLAILACNELKLPLKIVGVGKELDYLKSIANTTIEFLGQVNDQELDRLYKGAKALIFCALEEDFGIVPVEAMARGVPVIALKQGGVRETVIDGKTGVFFDKPDINSLITAIKQFNNLTIKQSACISQAKKFSKAIFKEKMKKFVEEKWQEKSI